MIEPRIESIPHKFFTGKRITMSFAENRTPELWGSFMPVRRAILNSIGDELYSIEVYPPDFFDAFDPAAAFEKWAAVEVSGPDDTPDGMENLTVPAGLYAVFLHRGAAAEAERTYGHIFRNWLPASEYKLDLRPHLAVMGKQYKNDDPDSEEDIWIPVVPK